jgi:hypothetical protein
MQEAKRRHGETLHQTATFADVLGASAPATDAHAQPLSVLRKPLRDAYGRFALRDPSIPENHLAAVWKLHALADWHMQKRQYLHGALTLHDTLISAAMFYLGLHDHVNHDQRQHAAANVNGVIYAHCKGRSPGSGADARPGTLNGMTREAWFEDFVAVWMKSTRLRNMLAHSGLSSHGANKKRSISKDRVCDLTALHGILTPLLPKMIGANPEVAPRV